MTDLRVDWRFLLRQSPGEPFSSSAGVRRKGRIQMAEAIGAIGAPNAAQYAVAVARKEHSQQAEEGRQAVQLIQASSAPELAASGSLGTKLNVVA